MHHALTQSADFMAQAMGADKVHAFVFNAENGSLVAAGASNTPLGRRQHELGLEREPLANQSPPVQVYETGESYYRAHADRDPNMTRGVVEAPGVRSYFAAPLQVDETPLGVLSAESMQPERFSSDERRFFEVAARWVAIIARRAELSEAHRENASDTVRRGAGRDLVSRLAHEVRDAIAPTEELISTMMVRLTRDGRERDVEDLAEITRCLQAIHAMVGERLDRATTEPVIPNGAIPTPA